MMSMLQKHVKHMDNSTNPRQNGDFGEDRGGNTEDKSMICRLVVSRPALVAGALSVGSGPASFSDHLCKAHFGLE